MSGARIRFPGGRPGLALVDRRFDRAAYDAEHTLDRFVTRLRNELDLGALSAALVGTAAETVRPRTTALWLCSGRGSQTIEPTVAGALVAADWTEVRTAGPEVPAGSARL